MSSLMEYITARFKHQVIYCWSVHCCSDLGVSPPEIIHAISYPTPLGLSDLILSPTWVMFFVLKALRSGIPCHPCEGETYANCSTATASYSFQVIVPCFSSCPCHPRHASPAGQRKSPLLLI